MAGERRGDPRAAPLVGTGPSLFVLACMVAVLLLPTGTTPARQLLLPNLAIVPLVLLTLRSREGIGPVGAFLAGLAIDVLTLGPLGLFAAGFLAVHAVLRYSREGLSVLPRYVRLGVLAAAAAAMLAMTWGSMLVSGVEPPLPVNVVLAFTGLMLIGLMFEIVLLLSEAQPRRPTIKRRRRRPKPGKSMRRVKQRAWRRPRLRSSLGARRL